MDEQMNEQVVREESRIEKAEMEVSRKIRWNFYCQEGILFDQLAIINNDIHMILTIASFITNRD